MLRSLHIENIAVIKSLDLDFGDGFSVLTGETGAGKSIIIDSINLLLGNRVSRELIRSGESFATVSAVFEDLPAHICRELSDMGFSCEDRTLMLRRTLHADGRSQSRLNGQAITQGVQKSIANLLINIHGQSNSQKLLQKSEHRTLLDAYAHSAEAIDAYSVLYDELKKVRKKISAVTDDEAEKLRLSEILRFQISDINALKLKDGEEEILLRDRDRLQHAEQINRQADLCYRALRGGEKVSAMSLLSRAEAALAALEPFVEGADQLRERLGSVISEIEDIAEYALSYADPDSEDPTAKIDHIEGRLEAISKLKRKYGSSIAEILAFRDKALARLDEIENSNALLEQLQKQERELLTRTEAAARILTDKRKAAAKEITAAVTDALCYLDMPKVRFEVAVMPCELGEKGADDVEFMIATNPGEPLLPMIKIASGGELSRIMLALKSVINDRDGIPTVIYDEVDTGVSGKTSRKVGIKLHDSAKNTQILCVTHSAQIASLADDHYLIEKHEKDGRSETTVRNLSEEERVEEIARILGGIEITDVQRSAAREMLREYAK